MHPRLRGPEEAAQLKSPAAQGSPKRQEALRASLYRHSPTGVGVLMSYLQRPAIDPANLYPELRRVVGGHGTRETPLGVLCSNASCLRGAPTSPSDTLDAQRRRVDHFRPRGTPIV